MSHRNKSRYRGFTIVELLVAVAIFTIIISFLGTFFTQNYGTFLALEENNIRIDEEGTVMRRMSQVIRSGTSISAAEPNKLTIYAYFSPQDSTLSQVTYYYDPGTKRLLVDRIPASGTAPNYTYLTSQKQTLELLKNFTPLSDLFKYYDVDYSSGPFDFDTFKDIKMVHINIDPKVIRSTGPMQVETTVMIRNRKTNL